MKAALLTTLALSTGLFALRQSDPEPLSALGYAAPARQEQEQALRERHRELRLHLREWSTQNELRVREAMAGMEREARSAFRELAQKRNRLEARAEGLEAQAEREEHRLELEEERLEELLEREHEIAEKRFELEGRRIEIELEMELVRRLAALERSRAEAGDDGHDDGQEELLHMEHELRLNEARVELLSRAREELTQLETEAFERLNRQAVEASELEARFHEKHRALEAEASELELESEALQQQAEAEIEMFELRERAAHELEQQRIEQELEAIERALEDLERVQEFDDEEREHRHADELVGEIERLNVEVSDLRRRVKALEAANAVK